MLAGPRRTSRKKPSASKTKTVPRVEALTQTINNYEGEYDLEDDYRQEDGDMIPDLTGTRRTTTTHRKVRGTSATSDATTSSEGYHTGEPSERRRPAATASVTTPTSTGGTTDLSEVLKMMTLQQENMLKFMAEFSRVQDSKTEQERLLHRERLQANQEREEHERERHDELVRLRERQEVQKQEADRRRERLRAIQLPPLMTNKTVLLIHLELFERTARRKEIPKEDWAATVIPLLSNRFRGTAMKLLEEVRDDYDRLKAALLERDDSNTKNAASTFWSIPNQKGTTALEYFHSILRLADWFVEREDRASFLDSLTKERLIQELPKDGRIYVRQRKPKSGLEATALAEEYFQNQEESFSAWTSERTAPTHNSYESYKRD